MTPKLPTTPESTSPNRKLPIAAPVGGKKTDWGDGSCGCGCGCGLPTTRQ